MAKDLPSKAYKLNQRKYSEKKADKEKRFIPGYGAIKTNIHFSTLLWFYWTGHTGAALSTDFKEKHGSRPRSHSLNILIHHSKGPSTRKTQPSWIIPDPASAFSRPALCPKDLARGGGTVQLVAQPGSGWCQASIAEWYLAGGGVGWGWLSALALKKTQPRWLCCHLAGQRSKKSFGLWPKKAFEMGPCEETPGPCLPQACCQELRFFKWAGGSGSSTQWLSFITVKASIVSNSFRHFLSWSCGPA